MPYRTIFAITAVTILGMAGVTSDALAFRGGSHVGGIHAGAAGRARGAHVGAADHGGINRGAINRGAIDRGAINRGAAYGAYRGYRPGVATGVGAAAAGAAAAGAAAAGPYYNSACGYPPYPPCQ
jgi:hypothetical protein